MFRLSGPQRKKAERIPIEPKPNAIGNPVANITSMLINIMAVISIALMTALCR
jgi:hypothetical protein